MRILTLTDRYPPVYHGGYELCCQEISEGLRSRGHDVQVLTTDLPAGPVRGQEHVHRDLHFISHRSTTPLEKRLMQARILLLGRMNRRLALHLARAMRPDLVFVWHALGIGLPSVVALQEAGFRTTFRIGSHWLVHLKNEQANTPSALKRWYRSLLFGVTDYTRFDISRAIFVSRSLAESYRRTGFRVGHSAVILTGIPSKWIASEPPPPRAPGETIRLLFAGRLEHEKGPQVAVAAVNYLVNVRGYQNITLDLVGVGQPTYVARLRHAISAERLEHIIRIQGGLAREDLMQRYSDYHALLFPTLRWEGLPGTIIEAMARGLPVIASDIGGPRDIITNGHDGILVPTGDVTQWARAIEGLIGSPEVGTMIGRAAIATVQQRHRFATMLDRYEDFLEQCIHSHVPQEAQGRQALEAIETVEAWKRPP